jgi:hypothetical protein
MPPDMIVSVVSPALTVPGQLDVVVPPSRAVPEPLLPELLAPELPAPELVLPELPELEGLPELLAPRPLEEGPPDPEPPDVLASEISSVPASEPPIDPLWPLLPHPDPAAHQNAAPSSQAANVLARA